MNPLEDSTAFGAPGIEPRWTSSAKEGVGTAHHTSCRVWFTLSHRIVNEIYYPHVDQPNTRDFQFLISYRRKRFATRKSATSTRLSRRGTRIYPSRILPCARCQGRVPARNSSRGQASPPTASPQQHVVSSANSDSFAVALAEKFRTVEGRLSSTV
jgi:hypothetical protein